MKQGIGFFDTGGNCPDMVIENGTLKADNSLETSMLVSAYSNRRVEAEDLPPGITIQEGWWADQFSEVLGDLIGSRLWTLDRGKIVDETVVEMQSILIQAFEWMTEDGIADNIVVTTERNGTNSVEGQIQVFKPDGDNIPFKSIWDGQELKIFQEG